MYPSLESLVKHPSSIAILFEQCLVSRPHVWPPYGMNDNFNTKPYACVVLFKKWDVKHDITTLWYCGESNAPRHKSVGKLRRLANCNRIVLTFVYSSVWEVAAKLGCSKDLNVDLPTFEQFPDCVVVAKASPSEQPTAGLAIGKLCCSADCLTNFGKVLCSADCIMAECIAANWQGFTLCQCDFWLVDYLAIFSVLPIGKLGNLPMWLPA